MDVKTAGRTVDLFELFAKMQTPLTLSEIARGLDMPQSSCFNLVRALVARGFIYSIGDKKQLYPTRKIFEIAGSIATYDPLLPRLKPKLEQLREMTKETTILGARQGDAVIYLAVEEGPQTIRYISYPGDIKAFHSSAIGKALLMEMPSQERSKFLQRLPKLRVTPVTITTTAALEADIELALDRGYAMTRGENVVDVMAIAVPFRIDRVVYAVSIAGPIGRLEGMVKSHAAAAREVFAEFLAPQVTKQKKSSRKVVADT